MKIYATNAAIDVGQPAQEFMQQNVEQNVLQNDELIIVVIVLPNKMLFLYHVLEKVHEASVHTSNSSTSRRGCLSSMAFDFPFKSENSIN